MREYESNVIKYVMTDLSNQLGVSALNRTTSAAKSELRGKFTLTLSETNNRGIGVSQDLVSWHDIKKEKMRCHVSDLFIFAIRRYSHVNGYTDKFKVTGYTTYKKMMNNSMDDTIKYYANENMNGEKRYDYAMINMLTCFLINYPGSSIISIPKLALVWPRPYNSFIYGADIAFVFLFHPLDRAAATERHNRRIAVIWSSLVRVTLPTRVGLGPAWNVLCCCCCCCCC